MHRHPTPTRAPHRDPDELPDGTDEIDALEEIVAKIEAAAQQRGPRARRPRSREQAIDLAARFCAESDDLEISVEVDRTPRGTALVAGVL